MGFHNAWIIPAILSALHASEQRDTCSREEVCKCGSWMMSLVVSPVDASHELAFAGKLCMLARPEWRVNEFKRLRGHERVPRRGAENERDDSRSSRTYGGGWSSQEKPRSVTAAVMHDTSFTAELRGGPGRGAKAICRPLYCRIVHTGAELCRPG